MPARFCLVFTLFILLSACAPAPAETPTPLPSATLEPTPIPPTATPDLRVGGFIVLDGKIYAAANDGALVEQVLPDDLRVEKLTFSAGNALLALDASGAEVARFENGVWVEMGGYPEGVVELAEGFYGVDAGGNGEMVVWDQEEMTIGDLEVAMNPERAGDWYEQVIKMVYLLKQGKDGGLGSYEEFRAQVANMGDKGMDGLYGMVDNPNTSTQFSAGALEIDGEVSLDRVAVRVVDPRLKSRLPDYQEFVNIDTAKYKIDVVMDERGRQIFRISVIPLEGDSYWVKGYAVYGGEKPKEDRVESLNMALALASNSIDRVMAFFEETGSPYLSDIKDDDLAVVSGKLKQSKIEADLDYLVLVK